MRILYVTDGFAPFVIGGMQAYARRQIEALVAAGHEVTTVSTGPLVDASAISWDNRWIAWPVRAPLDRLNPFRYANELRRFSVIVDEIVDSVSPDIVYSEGPLLHHYLRRVPRPAPAVFNPHGLEMYQRKGSLAEDVKSWPLRGIVADHARRADRVVSLSDGGQLYRILREIGVERDRIAVIPNAAPASIETARIGRGTGPRFLFVGRDEPRKALPLLVDAFGEIDGGELDVVGAGPLAGAAKSIRFHGPVHERGRVRQFYADADFLVAPSYAEGMPTVILEAFAAAMPVIATDVGANAGMVRTGETGFLIPRADKAALVAAMREAAALPSGDYASLSAACLAEANGRFSAAEATRALLSLLDGIVGLDRTS